MKTPLTRVMTFVTGCTCSFALAADSTNFAYIGTYTSRTSKGIYVSRFDPTTGRLSAPELAAETRNPSFLALSPDGRFLYAVGEVGDFGGQSSGAVSAFRRDPATGKLTLLNQQASGGSGPCHLAVEPGGKAVLVANYGGGSIAALPTQPDGSLGPAGSVIQHAGSSVNKERQAGPHAHQIITDPANQYAFVCDLGLDQVLVYRVDAGKATLAVHGAPASLKAGAGPRHLAFQPNGRFAYVINELNSTLTSFAYNAAKGQLTEVMTISTLPGDFKDRTSCAEVQVHPSGRFVYGSNRGHDTIAIFATDPTTGKISLVGHQSTQGKTPRHFTLDPSGQWLFAENQESDSVITFRVDPATGKLTPSGAPVTVSAPVCLVFAPGK